MTTNKELKPCPFCGQEKPTIWKRDDGWAVKCVNGCTVTIGGYVSQEAAVTAYNRRPNDASFS